MLLVPPCVSVPIMTDFDNAVYTMTAYVILQNLFILTAAGDVPCGGRKMFPMHPLVSRCF